VIVVSLDDTAVVMIGVVIGIVLFFSVVAALLGDAVVEVGLGVDCGFGEVNVTVVLVVVGTVGEGDVSVDPTVVSFLRKVGEGEVFSGKVGDGIGVADLAVVFFGLRKVDKGEVISLLETVEDVFGTAVGCETATPKTQNAKIRTLK